MLVPVVNVNEDSVDIYGDLDVGFHSNAGKSQHGWTDRTRQARIPLTFIKADWRFFLFLVLLLFITDNLTPNASQLKDSMDLYEELVTEEQQSKETLYTDVSYHVPHDSFLLSHLS